MRRKRKLEWYVLNEDRGIHGYGEIVMWNIFNNWVLEEDVQKHIKAYKKGKLDYEQFKEEVRKSIMWQEWSRCEYEILVSPFVAIKGEEQTKKVDCYYQVLPNLDALCHYLLEEEKK